jgi:hypothetical protein
MRPQNQIKDISGKRFGRLLAISFQGFNRVDMPRHSMWLFKCDCGNEIIVVKSSVMSGNTSSCGCFRMEVLAEIKLKHGKRNHPLYQLWRGMRARCNNPKHAAYLNYGGRGIRVCERWDDFNKFIEDVGERPLNTSLDRIDNDGPYCPENCRWISRHNQSRNTRRNVRVLYQGVNYCLKDLCEMLNIKYKRVQEAVLSGKDIDSYINGAKLIKN